MDEPITVFVAALITETVLLLNFETKANLPSGVTPTPTGKVPTLMGAPTTVFVSVSITDTLFEPELEIYALTSIWPSHGREAQMQVPTTAANTHAGLSNPWPARLPLLNDPEVADAQPNSFRSFMLFISIL